MKTPITYNLPIQRMPLIGNIAKMIDRIIGQQGLAAAAHELLTMMKTKLTVKKYSEAVDNVIQTGQVLVLGNHEHMLEVVALLAAMPNRKDIYTVGVAGLKGFGPNFAKHLLPVHIRPASITAHEMKLTSRIGRALGLGVAVPPNAQEINAQSIRIAAELISNGAMVIMFPSGVRKTNSVWSVGVGYLVDQIARKDKTSIVFAYVTGASNLDFLRLIPGIRCLLPKFSVTLSTPIAIKDLPVTKGSPKQIAKYLHSEYISWVKTISI